MSRDDDAVRRILQSGKEESDHRSALGLPLDGNFDQHKSGQANYEGSGVGGSFFGMILMGIAYALFYAVCGAVLLAVFMLKLFVSAIFSRRR